MKRIAGGSTIRCRRDQEDTRFFLLRIFNSAGREIARAALSESGLYAFGMHRTAFRVRFGKSAGRPDGAASSLFEMAASLQPEERLVALGGDVYAVARIVRP